MLKNMQQGKGEYVFSIRPVILGVIAGTASILLLLYITAAMITWKKVLPENLLNGLITVILCIGAGIGGWTAARTAGKYGILYGAAAGILMGIGTIAAGVGVYAFSCTATAIVKPIMMTLCAAIVGVITVNQNNKTKL